LLTFAPSWPRILPICGYLAVEITGVNHIAQQEPRILRVIERPVSVPVSVMKLVRAYFTQKLVKVVKIIYLKIQHYPNLFN
jgi:hypothetical protein